MREGNIKKHGILKVGRNLEDPLKSFNYVFDKNGWSAYYMSSSILSTWERRLIGPRIREYGGNITKTQNSTIFMYVGWVGELN